MKDWIQWAMLALMAVSLVGALFNRWQLKRGIGGRTIQFVGLTWVLGIAVILALEGVLEGVWCEKSADVRSVLAEATK